MPRSRNGCVTCKRRHRKCDETKPTCLECDVNGIQCDGYSIRLQWDVGVASRGFLRGAAIPVSMTSASRTMDSLAGESQTVPDPGSFQVAPGKDASLSTDYRDVNVTNVRPRHERSDKWIGPKGDNEAASLFKQFNEKTIFLLYSTSIYDPFKANLERSALQSEALYNILVAVQIYTTSPNNPPPLFHEYFDRSLGLYREKLDLLPDDFDADALLMGLFICTIHLFQATPWTTHLGHIMRTYKLCQAGQTPRLIRDPNFRFPMEAIAVMDLPTFVRGRQTPTLGIWAHLRSEQAIQSDEEGGIETMSGLPRTLLDIFSGLSDPKAEQAFVNWPGHIGEPPHCHLWEAYRLAGILVGRRFRNERRDAVNEPQHSHLLAKNSILYPCTAIRLEVAVLQSNPAWVEVLKRYESFCAPYHETPNSVRLKEILDEALEVGKNDVDLDMQAKQRGLLGESTHIVLVPTPSKDPNDPLNWTRLRKNINLLLVLALTIATFTAIIMQLIFWQQMIVDLDVTYDQLNAGVAANAAGLAVGCLLFIPLTRKYGCRSSYIISTGAMAGVTWWSSRLETAAEIYATNFLYGLAGSLNETISEITIAHLFFVHQRGTANGLYIVAVMLGNFICPTIAGIQAASQGWRWSYRTAGIVLTVLFFLFLFCYEETKYIPVSDSQLLNDASAQLRNKDANQSTLPSCDLKNAVNLEAKSQDNTDLEPQQFAFKRSKFDRLRLITPTDEPLLKSYIKPFKMAKFPYILFTALQVANAVTFLVLLSTVNSIVFTAPPYNFNTEGVGLMLMGPFIGNILGSLYGGLLGDWLVVRTARRNNGVFEPEMRLYILPLPSLCFGAGLALFGISADQGWHWIYPNIGGALFGFGMASMMDVSCTIIIDIYEGLTAEAFIFITLVRNIPAIGVPFGVVSWISSVGLSKLFVISGCISTLICLTCIPVMIWGRRMRVATWAAYESILERSSTERH
ncbi:major facilitator superfamily domain-containing protein [Mariannaea sp. PMI_226]|nr:major facilitator superfamily domain-containing protein [Mariannaea sp. PMI_226]